MGLGVDFDHDGMFFDAGVVVGTQYISLKWAGPIMDEWDQMNQIHLTELAGFLSNIGYS